MKRLKLSRTCATAGGGGRDDAGKSSHAASRRFARVLVSPGAFASSLDSRRIWRGTTRLWLARSPPSGKRASPSRSRPVSTKCFNVGGWVATTLSHSHPTEKWGRLHVPCSSIIIIVSGDLMRACCQGGDWRAYLRHGGLLRTTGCGGWTVDAAWVDDTRWSLPEGVGGVREWGCWTGEACPFAPNLPSSARPGGGGMASSCGAVRSAARHSWAPSTFAFSDATYSRISMAKRRGAGAIASGQPASPPARQPAHTTGPACIALASRIASVREKGRTGERHSAVMERRIIVAPSCSCSSCPVRMRRMQIY